MTDDDDDLDTSILDELDRRQRRAALAKRVQKARKRAAPRSDLEHRLEMACRKVEARQPKGESGFKDPAVRARAAATRAANKGESIAARREREGDEIADALLAICTRLAEERGIPTNNNGGTEE